MRIALVDRGVDVVRRLRRRERREVVDGQHVAHACEPARRLEGADEHIEAMKQAWGEIGDSIVVVGGDGLWNCHVHSNDIGAAIEAPLALGGRPFQIRVTDLFE